MEEGTKKPSVYRVDNPPNPFFHSQVEWIDTPPPATLDIYEEQAKSILSKNDSPDISFRYSLNPYRGCFHACAYCYARPSHQYLDFGAGTDFERKIVVKVNAASLLREAFMKQGWEGEPIVFSGNTDCYQPLELCYELTRSCLSVCLEFRNPVSIITKGAIIRRDIELLQELNKVSALHVTISCAFADDKISKKLEPGAPRPSLRFKVLKELSDAGIQTAVGIAPIIPGLNDAQIPEILERAKDAGASSAFMTLLRLPGEVKEVFGTRLEEHFPSKSLKVLHQIQEMKGGLLNRSEFGKRMVGQGARWEAIDWMFKSNCNRLGLNSKEDRMIMVNKASSFKRPQRQLQLW